MSDIINLTRTYRFSDGVKLSNSQVDSEFSNIVDRINRNLSYVTSNIYSTSTVARPGSSLTTATYTDITSLTLSDGEWDVWGVVRFIVESTSLDQIGFGGGISITSGNVSFADNADFPNNLVDVLGPMAPASGSGYDYIQILPSRFHVNPGGVTVYLKAYASFASGTAPKASGTITARRVNI